jgi:hypothetical protein
MNADKTAMVGGFDHDPARSDETRSTLAFIGVHRRSSAVNSDFDLHKT